MATALNTFFFAPRYVTSRFQMLALQPLWGGDWKGTGRARKIIAKEYAKYLTGLALMYSMAMAAGYEIEWDPRSTDFGKIKDGHVRIDPLSGFSQSIVIASKLLSGKSKSTSTHEIKDIYGAGLKYGATGSAGYIGKFLRQKFSPLSRFVMDNITGSDVMDRPVTPQSNLENFFVPLSFRDIYDVMKDQGYE